MANFQGQKELAQGPFVKKTKGSSQITNRNIKSIFRVVSQHCPRSTLRFFLDYTAKNSTSS